MTAAIKKGLAAEEPVAWENPLIPNKRLRALYVAMVESRLLDEHMGKRPGRATDRPKSIRGEEGCRVSTTLDLKTGDLTSEGAVGVATGFLLGAKLADVILSAKSAAPGQLPAVAAATDRLNLAMGAALILKSTRKGGLLIVYVHSDEIALPAWKPLLRFASEQILSVIFVVLPAAAGTKAIVKPGQLSLTSSKCGVPGITVDAADPVALYRVAQESMLRARAGGGPVLIECIRFHIAGQKAAPADPIETMRDFLLHRKIVDQAWLRGVEDSFRARLMAAGR